jgi:hypothetical protein
MTGNVPASHDRTNNDAAYDHFRLARSSASQRIKRKACVSSGRPLTKAPPPTNAATTLGKSERAAPIVAVSNDRRR